jgi:hypothetical protein
MTEKLPLEQQPNNDKMLIDTTSAQMPQNPLLVAGVAISKRLSKFRGIGISPFNIQALWFDGYGFSILKIRFDKKGKMCTMTNTYSLFNFNVKKSYDRGGSDWVLSITILFYRFKNIVRQINPKQNICDNCSELCESTDFDKDGKHYCCNWCRD